MTEPETEIVPVEKYARLAGERRSEMGARMARLYSDGCSVKDVANRTGRSYGAAHRMLLEAGVTMRPRGGAHL